MPHLNSHLHACMHGIGKSKQYLRCMRLNQDLWCMENGPPSENESWTMIGFSFFVVHLHLTSHLSSSSSWRNNKLAALESISARPENKRKKIKTIVRLSLSVSTKLRASNLKNMLTYPTDLDPSGLLQIQSILLNKTPERCSAHVNELSC